MFILNTEIQKRLFFLMLENGKPVLIKNLKGK